MIICTKLVTILRLKPFTNPVILLFSHSHLDFIVEKHLKGKQEITDAIEKTNLDCENLRKGMCLLYQLIGY